MSRFCSQLYCSSAEPIAPRQELTGALLSQNLGHCLSRSHSLPNIFCVLSKCLFHYQPVSDRTCMKEHGTERVFFVFSTELSNSNFRQRVDSQPSKSAEKRKVGSCWSFQGHEQPLLIVYLQAALLMWLQSANSIAALCCNKGERPSTSLYFSIWMQHVI